jgi:hypothetical protein
MFAADRPPSSTWEQISLADEPHNFVWVWFKPPGAPQGIALQIPEQTLRDPRRGQPLTMRRLLAAVRVEPLWVAFWSLYGIPYDGQQGMNPVLDYPIPEPGPGADSTIHIVLHSPVPSSLPPIGMPPVAPPGTASDVFSRMDAEWNASLQLEPQLAAAAKQLNGTLLRINSLNRDFSSDEARAADQLDKHEWQDVRRALRDVAARLSRFLKDQHLGMTSNAGKRNAYETIYQQYVVPRRNFDGLVQAERDFEQYRKTMQTLLGNMNTAQTAALQEGERRAQMILSRVAAKVRTARSKR